MANTEFSQQIRQGVEALRAEDGSEPLAACRAGDLKGLLNAIVDQISEADRRHTDTLQQLQDRLAGIGREAKAIKPRVPDSYAAAFERIEAGMSELASRIAEASDVRAEQSENAGAAVNAFDEAAHRIAPVPAAPAAYAAASPYSEPPAALRSASDTSAAATRRREEAVSRANAGVDTFDVIESSLPGNVTDPWDRDAAEALTGHYESGAAGYQAKSLAHDIAQNDTRSPAAAMAVAAISANPAAVPGVDHVWLEARFADISKRIDESLSEIRPDQGFFALGQRVEQFEQHFSNLFESVATRGDVEGIRLIEAHVSELAGHLENAHQQLLRLDAIEDQLSGIAGKLDDVHQTVLHSSSDPAMPLMQQPEIDMDQVARTAAEAAAQQFARLQPVAPPQQDTSEVRDMLRGFIAESRQGDENTTALLDTLQQAMIRLLDRVDSMELNAIQSAQAQAQSAPQEYVREQVRFGVDPARAPAHVSGHAHGHMDGEPVAALDAAVAAVASAKTMASPFAQSPAGTDYGAPQNARPAAAADAPATRSPEKMRQDFIAEARRAKMRLAAENEAVAGGVTLGGASEELSADPVRGPAAQRAAGKSGGKATSKPASASAITPRLKVLALVGIVGLAGAWLMLQYGPGANGGAPFAAITGTADKSASIAKPASPKSEDETGGAAQTADPATGKPDGGAEQMNITPGTRGEIVSDELTVGSTSVPLYGVAVDSERPMSAAELSRAQRQQAMANVSGQLGQAAVQNPAALAMPAAIQANEAADAVIAGVQGSTNVAKGSMSQSSALDLPPATVGPLSLRLAAANGDPSAEFEVGARLAEGKGTDQSFKDAAKWYQRSASRGFAQAQYRLGTLYERGLGLKAEPARAEEWYRRAAEQGNVKAMHNLAVLSANTTGGTTPDYATAATWFEKAAELGLSDSQFNLAVLHENGLGVPQDLTTAYKWLSLAAKGGDKEAVRRRDILKGKLTGEQLAKSDGLLATWRAKLADPQVNDPRKAGEAWKKNPANGVNG